MSKVIAKKIKKRTVSMYLITVMILLNSTTMYTRVTNSVLYGVGFGWPLGIACLLYVIQTKKFKPNNSIIIYLPLLFLALIVYAIVTRYNIQRYLVAYVGVFVTLFIFSYALYSNGEMGDFLKIFSNVMLFIAIISVFFWLFGSVLDFLPGRNRLTYYWAEQYRPTYSYWYLYFENPAQNSEGLCNLGIFTEAPGYSGFLTYAMLIEMVNRKGLKKRKELQKSAIRILIYVITLLSTRSTKGIIVVLIAFAIEYITKKNKNKWLQAAKIIIGIFIVVGVMYLSYKLLKNKMDTKSGRIRLDDLLSQIKTFMQHPIFGVGYGNVEAIQRNQLVERPNPGLSMGLTVLLAYGGLWFFTIYAGAVIKSRDIPYFRNNRKAWLLVVLVLIYNLFVSNSGFTDPYIFAVCAAYAAPPVRRSKHKGII